MGTGRHSALASSAPSTGRHIARLIVLIAGCVVIIAGGFAIAIFLAHLYVNSIVH